MNKDKLINIRQNNQNQSIKEDKQNKEKNKPTSLEKSPKEVGGKKGLEPTRYGDWEKKGRCIDF